MNTSTAFRTAKCAAITAAFLAAAPAAHANDANVNVGPLTHVPGNLPDNVPAQPDNQNLPQQPLPQIPASSVPNIPQDAHRPSRAPGPQLPEPQLPRMPDAPSQRAPDHLIEGIPGGDAHHDRIRESNVNRLFDNALRIHPSELEGLREAEEIRQVPGIEGTEIDPYATPGQGNQAGLIPGQQRAPGQGPTFESQGFQRPEGMPDSPLPNNSGQGPRRLVGPPSANLRDAAGGIAGTDPKDGQSGGVMVPREQTMDVYTQEAGGTRVVSIDRESGRVVQNVLITEMEDGTVVVAGWQETEPGEYWTVFRSNTPGIPASEGLVGSTRLMPSTPGNSPNPPPIDRTQDGDADPTGGSGVNPITGLPTRPPKQNPDQVNPGPDGAVVRPAGTRLRPGDLEVNPDPERQGQGFNPGETMRRFESPDQVDPPPVGPGAATP